MVDSSAKTQKIKTTSSAEAEVVAVYENMPAIMWVRSFFKAQGSPLKPTTLHQDNTSAMLLELNGQAFSSRRIHTMNIRSFFVGDVAKRQHVTVNYCPTDELIGGFFTKPVGGGGSAASATLS